MRCSVPLLLAVSACRLCPLGDNYDRCVVVEALDPLVVSTEYSLDDEALVERARVDFVMARPDGSTEVIPLGTDVAGRATQNDPVPIPRTTIEKGTRLGFWFDGGTLGSDPFEVAWAETIVPRGAAFDAVWFDAFGSSNPPIQVAVLTGRLATPGLLKVGKEQLSMSPTTLLAAGEDLLAFGEGPAGAELSLSTTRSPSTWDKDSVPMPTDGADAGAAVWLPDRDLALYTGGRPDRFDRAGAVDTALLVNLPRGKVPFEGQMTSARSEHLALSLGGSTLLIGGFDGAGAAGPATWETFDSETDTFEARGTLQIGAVGFAHAVTDEGLLLCGGGIGDADLVPQAACQRIGEDLAVTDAPPLPVPLIGAAMAPMDTGQVLLTGGVSTTLPAQGTAVATDRAWVLDGDTWIEAAPLAEARASHRMWRASNGWTVVVGGAAQLAANAYLSGDAVVATEVFDEFTEAFTTVESGRSFGGARMATDSFSGVVCGFHGFEAGEVEDNDMFVLGLGPDFEIDASDSTSPEETQR